MTPQYEPLDAESLKVLRNLPPPLPWDKKADIATRAIGRLIATLDVRSAKITELQAKVDDLEGWVEAYQDG